MARGACFITEPMLVPCPGLEAIGIRTNVVLTPQLINFTLQITFKILSRCSIAF